VNLTRGENGMSYHDKITLEDLSIEVEDIEELESGDALIKFKMSPDVVKIFCEIGLRQTLIESAERAEKKYNHIKKEK
jgi:hypothetical protein